MQKKCTDMLHEEACGSEDPGAGASDRNNNTENRTGRNRLTTKVTASPNGKDPRGLFLSQDILFLPEARKTMQKNKKEKLRNMTFTAVCIALCPVMPFIAGVFPNGRQLFSPMHIPALLCGLVTGPAYGLAAGMLGPLFSFAVTGMPPGGKLPQMMLELGCYGLVTGLGMKYIRSGKLRSDLWLSMLIAMIAGRIVGGLANALIFMRGEYSMKLWASAYFAGTAPGIVIHLLVIPAVYFALEQAKLIPRRYPR